MKKLIILSLIIFCGCAGRVEKDPGTEITMTDESGKTHTMTINKNGQVRGMNTVDWGGARGSVMVLDDENAEKFKQAMQNSKRDKR